MAAARTPVVSAIGHDVDTPLLDLVADWRASTPTDAAKAVVPDAAAERARHTAGAACGPGARWRAGCDGERRHLVALRSRPVMADPRAHHPRAGARSSRRCGTAPGTASPRQSTAPADQIDHLRAQVRTLSPQSTLERGYAVVQHADGRVVMDHDDLEVGELLRVRVARGDFARPRRSAAAD